MAAAETGHGRGPLDTVDGPERRARPEGHGYPDGPEVAGLGRTGAARAEAESTGQMPKYPEAQGPSDGSHAAARTAEPTNRPPVSAVPPQPAPPTGEPLNTSAGALPYQRTPHEAPPLPPAMPEQKVLEPELPRRDEPVPSSRPVTGAPRGSRRLLPIGHGERRTPAPRSVAAAACLVLGVGLLGGSAVGAWLSGPPGTTVGDGDFDDARALWREVPVDDLFPQVLQSDAAGPGGADRRWTRAAVSPDSGCTRAFDPMLAKALSPVGCGRLVRATYVDETTSGVTTVGLLFTKSDQDGMKTLRKRFAVENLTERTDLMPRPYAARGTVSADFGDAQRASWTVHVLSDAPVVVYSVTGFADGRVVSDPQAAAEATEQGETSAAAQSGLGNDAQGLADAVEQSLRKSAGTTDGVSGAEDGGADDGGGKDDGTRPHGAGRLGAVPPELRGAGREMAESRGTQPQRTARDGAS